MFELKDVMNTVVSAYGDALNLNRSSSIFGNMIGNIIRHEIYDGIVRDVLHDEKDGDIVRVTIYDDQRGDRLEDYFSHDLFKDGIPSIGSAVLYHALQYENSKYGGYFTKGITRKRPFSDFDPKLVAKVDEYFSEDNDVGLRSRLEKVVRSFKSYFSHE